MVAILLILGGLLIVGSFVYIAWADRVWPIFTCLLLGIGSCVLATVLYQQHVTQSCHSAGGHIYKTGKVTTTYVMVGNVMVPMTDEETECRIP